MRLQRRPWSVEKMMEVLKAVVGGGGEDEGEPPE